jgi:XTP/dITP diphosphohydrolase
LADVPRRFTGDTLVIASHNPGKVREIADLLEPHGITVRSAGELGLPEPAETGDSFRANAALKAQAGAAASGLPVLADDSGLAVDALGGKPGIHSARWAGPERDFGRAMRKLESALVNCGSGYDTPGANRRAHFVSALCLAWPDGHVECFEGEVYGSLVWPPRGDNGFGYDPMFLPDGQDETFGEMVPEWKHVISHRAVAFQKLVEGCFADAA